MHCSIGPLYKLHIEYSQNGRVISDEVFATVQALWCAEDIERARRAANALLSEMGCGTVSVYTKTVDGRRYEFTHSFYPFAGVR